MNKSFEPQRAERRASQTLVDPLADTQPTRPKDWLADYQPVLVVPAKSRSRVVRQRRRPGCGCVVVLLILFLIAAYLFFPPRMHIVLMGIDDRAPGGALGRSDTLILVSLQPYRRYVGMLSIPRDLWVLVPGYGENRINTAHFFAEAQAPGSGPQAVKGVIQANFGVQPRFYVRARFDNFKQVIDTLGGVEITLAEPVSGYPSGTHRLDGDQALAFVRDRSGADDFARMRKAQILLRSLVSTALLLRNWTHWPQIARVAFNAVETDIPLYLWPRVGFALLLAGPDGIEARIIDREMVTPFLTENGGQVLAPRWELIRPLIQEMFGE